MFMHALIMNMTTFVAPSQWQVGPDCDQNHNGKLEPSERFGEGDSREESQENLGKLTTVPSKGQRMGWGTVRER